MAIIQIIRLLELKKKTPNVTRSRKNALKKLEKTRADLDFANKLKSQY